MFISPDSIVPDPFDPQTLNRYSYCRNNPLIYVDPSGNVWGYVAAAVVGAMISGSQSDWDPGAMITGAFVSAVSYGAFTAVSSAVQSSIIQAGLNATAGGMGPPTAGLMAAGEIGGVIAGGTAAGATAGGLNAAFYGGNVWEGMLEGAGYGALSAGVSSGLYQAGVYYPLAAAAGGYAAGGEDGFKFALVTSMSAWVFKGVVGEEPNPGPGTKDVYKKPNELSYQDSNNVGIAIRPNSNAQIRLYHEHHWFMKLVGKAPLFNAFATFHDNLQVKWHIPESVWYGGAAYGVSHAFALGATYSAYCATSSPTLWQYLYTKK